MRAAVATVATVWVLLLILGGCSEPDDVRNAPGETRSSPGSASPEEFSAGIDQFVESTLTYRSLRAVLIIVEGRTVVERYYQTSAAEYRDIESVTKSVMSTLVGIAIDEGLIRDVDQTLAELLPSYAASMKRSVARTTLRQVLTATGGFEGEIDEGAFGFTESEDWVRGVLDRAVRRPGRQFAYSNGGAHLLSAILQQSTGMSVLDYARAKLFDPLVIPTRPAAEPAGDFGEAHNLDAYLRADFAWPVDPQRRHLGWAMIKLRPRDMARLGLLYLQEGRWKHRQVVPARWVQEATTAKVATEELLEGYGYMWWTTTMGDDPAYIAWGYGGQLIEVVPARDLVVVVSSDVDLTGQTPARIGPSNLLSMVTSYIEPATRR
jgi:CubicO group peptidase (beta-lactamase class C family)